MKILTDYQGLAIRLTEERLAHILEHPEMRGLERAIGDTLSVPQMVIQSASDSEARLYYRYYEETPVSEKFLCVLVKVTEEDAFIITAYLTERIKKGAVLWPRNV